MLFSIALLIVIIYLAFKAAPVEKKEHALIHGAGQIGLLAAMALFGVDYFTSYFYATGEMMSALHPYNLQQYAFIAVSIIALANAIFGFLYMYSLGVFNEGGGSLHSFDALPGTWFESDRCGGVDPGLCIYDCGFNPFGRGPDAITDRLKNPPQATALQGE